jgi:queuine tRNA-ribosyltransferase
MPEFGFEIIDRDPKTRARTGVLHTPHGDIETPVFMPVGTAGSVKGMTQDQLDLLGVQILLGNTYHLYLRPGHEAIRDLGGLHRFMGWRRPILTDSGGFQAMSLKGLSRVTEDGVSFKSHLDGSSHFLSPERAVEIQLALGSDVMMCLDEVVEYPATHGTAKQAVATTGRWSRRAKEFHEQQLQAAANRTDPTPFQCGETVVPNVLPEAAATDPPQIPAGSPVHDRVCPVPDPFESTLFGIVQGGVFPDLRRESAEQIVDVGFEGYAIGGLSVGEPKTELYEFVDLTAGLLPDGRPRYLMGVGTPGDLAECVALGVDMFDCVMPTRNARNGCLFTSEGKLTIKNARFARDDRPPDLECSCQVCRRYSRAYLRHLFVAGEMLAGILATHHNLHFYLDTMRQIRQAIRFGEYETFLSKVRAGL